MVRALQKKFIKAAMLAITLLILAIFIAINVFDIVSANQQLNSRMEQLCEYGGERGRISGGNRHDHSDDSDDMIPPEEISGELPEEWEYDDIEDLIDDDFPDVEHTDEFVRDFMDGNIPSGKTARDIFLTSAYFTVRFNANDEVVYIDVSQISSLTEENASAIALEVYKNGKSSGRAGDYMYTIIENDSNLGHTVIFLDTSQERSNILRILFVSLGICVVSWLIMLALVIFLSKKAIRPIAENIERQKQFVTNAGHELKTPLAIIQSNTEALELFNGENKWSKNIKSQVTRLNDLTRNLLTLSRMDESADSMLIEDINFSELVSGQLQSFVSSYEQKNISLSTDIQDDVHCKGDRGQLTQLLNLLFDNAVKYTNENGQMKVSLSKKGSKIQFISENTCGNLPECPPEKLFDRFYRSDESHSQKTGGQGIGLSVVASIAENHNGSIKAEYSASDTSISFILRL